MADDEEETRWEPRRPRGDRALLAEIVESRCPQLLPSLSRFPEAISIPEREALEEALSTELGETGFLPSDEPTTRGLAIEELIGELFWHVTD